MPGPMMLASRSITTSTSGRRRENPRTYPSTSTESLPQPLRGSTFAPVSSVNMAGSRGLEPYTAALDFTPSRCTVRAFWHAASSCIVPMTLISFMETLPPAWVGVAMTFMWTTVSTSARAMTLAMTGLRMSARTKSAVPMSCGGGTTSTPMTRSMPGSAVRTLAKRPPRYRETPVTRTTRAIGYPLGRGQVDRAAAAVLSTRGTDGARDASLLVAALVTRLAQQLPVLLLGHPLAALLDDGAHVSSGLDPVERSEVSAYPCRRCEAQAVSTAVST